MRHEQAQLGLRELSVERDPNETLERPPVLQGHTYDPQEAYKARDNDRLLTLRIEANMACNLNCRYCPERDPDEAAVELPYDKMVSVVRQARELGAESIVILGGEPTMYSRFRDLINAAYLLGMRPVIVSNLMDIDAETARFLSASNASVLGKVDSFYRELQDFLSGKRGAWERIRQGLHNLKQAGFTRPADPHRSRLGLSFVANRLNMVEMDEMWHFCRQHDIFPNLELLPPPGKAGYSNQSQALSLEEIEECKLRILRLDRDYYGFDWLPYTPVPGSACLQYLYSLYVTVRGNVRPCCSTRLEENPDLHQDNTYPYNIHRMSLRDIYGSSLFRQIRNVDRNLEGKCGDCENLSECIGCRGQAYSVATGKGQDPMRALQSECPLCFRDAKP